MPTYKYHCQNCDSVFTELKDIEERNNATCPECGSDEVKMQFGTHNRGFKLEPQWFEHLDTEPVYIKSKKHLREECKKRGVRAKALEGGV